MTVHSPPYRLAGDDVGLRIHRMTGDPSEFHGFVWLVQDVQTKLLWRALAREVVDKHRLFPIITVATPQDAGEYDRQLGSAQPCAIVQTRDIYDHIVSGGDRSLEDEQVRRAVAALEIEYGFSVWRDMVVADRHLGRGFTTGARAFPSSRTSSAPPRLVLEACLVTWSFWRALEQRFPPRMILGYTSGGGITGFPYTRIAEKCGAPYRNISYTRFNDRFYWADGADAFAARFAAHLEWTPAPSDDDVARVAELAGGQVIASPEHFAKLKRERTWPVIARAATTQVARRSYGHWRGYAKARRGYYLGSILKSMVRRRLNDDYLDRVTATSLDEVGNRRILYFTLQSEPEVTTYLYGRYSTDQLNVLRECALSLPSEAVLVVKEHPWHAGHRDPGYYEEIRRLPNVLFVHPGYPSIEIIRRSAAVCTTSGSAVYQAAVLGIYAFHCQRRSLLDPLPHVIRLSARSDFDRLQAAVRDTDPASLQRRRRDGARLYLALASFGFASGPHGLLLRKVDYSAEELQDIIADLDDSLPDGIAALGRDPRGAMAPEHSAAVA